MPYAPILLLLGYGLLLAGPPLVFALDARDGRVSLDTFKSMGISALFGIAILFGVHIASSGAQ